MDDITIYSWQDYPDDWVRTNSRLNRLVLQRLSELRTISRATRLFELGCGNGSFARLAGEHGFDVVGVDPSPEAIRKANSCFPTAELSIGSSQDDLAGRFGTYPLVVSLEVIEHVFAPRKFVSTIWNLLEPGGSAIISTPYHGYWKNLILALTGRMDRHFTALWDGGHIKFFSVNTLRTLLVEAGFQPPIAFYRVGRIPALAKSMVAVARRPDSVRSQSLA